ncbi:MOSC domain-containing protein [Pseudonocardia sp. GCM10023141]|uniref:MOSC domain-containing protein n=1 Tax=Pseudonocardia sp. GCM10023141 TaxID=3252653 RepID=UPI0036160644
MRITTMWRYPVKSMLGERLDEARLAEAGLESDRGLALIDATTGLVATAKHPRLWRDLLKYSATVTGHGVVITSPAGWTRDARDPGVDELLSVALGRAVRLSAERPVDATVERPDPEDVLDRGVEAEVAAATLEIGQGTPGTNFVDYAPVHVITTATLDRIGTEQVRYRPNLVVETPPGTEPFVENSWMGRELHIGGAIVLRMTLPTPRCSVPTLEHGELPRAPHAVRIPMRENRVDVTGFGVLPCAGGYAEVVRAGVAHIGDEVTLR